MRRVYIYIFWILALSVAASSGFADDALRQAVQKVADLEREIIDFKMARADSWLFWMAVFVGLVVFIATVGLAIVAVLGFISVQTVREIERDAKDSHENIKETNKSIASMEKDIEKKREELKRNEGASVEGDDVSHLDDASRQKADSNPTDAEEQWILGQRYEIGDGVPQNDETAVYWYRKSAEQGNPEGQWQLGLMYEFGEGLPENKKEAAKWYRKSAEQNDATGQYFLAYAYKEGKGVPQNFIEARAWFSLSKSNGDEDAEGKMSELDAKMTVEDISKSQERAKELQAEIEEKNN
jgi:hypothetical protein